MTSHHTDYRPLIGYEDMYEVNRFCKIRHKLPTILCRGIQVPSREHKPKIDVRGKVTYVILRDKDFKNRKINLTKMVINIFGRQRPIEIKHDKPIKDFVKPINKRGRRGIPVEQFEDGKPIGVFPTFAAAALAVCGTSAKISDAAYGKIKMYAGYKWQIKNNKK